jgi:hypothetical protein
MSTSFFWNFILAITEVLNHKVDYAPDKCTILFFSGNTTGLVGHIVNPIETIQSFHSSHQYFPDIVIPCVDFTSITGLPK